MNLLSRKIHAFLLIAAICVAAVSFASNSVFAQVVTILFEERDADSKTTAVFEAQNGPFEIRWSATGGGFLVKVLDDKDSSLVSSQPQERKDAGDPPMTGNLAFEGPGTFKLGVVAGGPWHIRVIQTNR